MCWQVAAALKAEKLILMTDVPGVMRDKDDISTKFTELDIKDTRQLVEEGIIAGGMIPKVLGRLQLILVALCAALQWQAYRRFPIPRMGWQIVSAVAADHDRSYPHRWSAASAAWPRASAPRTLSMAGNHTRCSWSCSPTRASAP